MRPGRRIALAFAIAGLAAGAVFAFPAPRAQAAEPDTEAVLAELPFLDHPEPNRIVVDLAPEGHRRRLKLMLDTGASHTLATVRAARELGLHVRRQKRGPYRRSTLLGRDLLIHVDTRRSDTASRTGWEFAVLGGNFLAEYVVELDFPARRVRLLDPDRYEVPERADPGRRDEAVLPLEIVARRPAVEVLLNGRPTLLLIDTGAPLPLALSGEVAESAGVREHPSLELGLGTAVGPVRSHVGWVERLEIGPFVHEGVAIEVAPRGVYNLGVSGDSVLGCEGLAGYRVRIDYPRRRLWLRRSADGPRTFLGLEHDDLDDLAAKLRERDETESP